MKYWKKKTKAKSATLFNSVVVVFHVKLGMCITLFFTAVTRRREQVLLYSGSCLKWIQRITKWKDWMNFVVVKTLSSYNKINCWVCCFVWQRRQSRRRRGRQVRKRSYEKSMPPPPPSSLRPDQPNKKRNRS